MISARGERGRSTDRERGREREAEALRVVQGREGGREAERIRESA